MATPRLLYDVAWKDAQKDSEVTTATAKERKGRDHDEEEDGQRGEVGQGGREGYAAFRRIGTHGIVRNGVTEEKAKPRRSKWRS